MSVIAGVVESLRDMSLLQLLFAFVACAGYAVAQGALVGRRGKRTAWSVCIVAALSFALDGTAWTNAVILLAFAVAGLGAFVGAVWLISWALGLVEPGAADEPRYGGRSPAVQAVSGLTLRRLRTQPTKPTPPSISA